VRGRSVVADDLRKCFQAKYLYIKRTFFFNNLCSFIETQVQLNFKLCKA